MKLTEPDALYAGERYVLETVPAPQMGVPFASVEFVMPDHHEQLSLDVDRPRANLNLLLVDAKARSGHWSASLPLPGRAKIRVRHPVLGVVLPEQEIIMHGGANNASSEWDVPTVFHRHDRDRSGDIDAIELRDALNELGVATDSRQARAVLVKYDRDKSGKLEFDEFVSV